MDENQFATLQATMRLVALEAIVSWQTQIVDAWRPPPETTDRTRKVAALKSKLLQLRVQRSDLTFDESTPEISDLKAAAFRDAFDSICNQI